MLYDTNPKFLIIFFCNRPMKRVHVSVTVTRLGQYKKKKRINKQMNLRVKYFQVYQNVSEITLLTLSSKRNENFEDLERFECRMQFLCKASKNHDFDRLLSKLNCDTHLIKISNFRVPSLRRYDVKKKTFD